MVRNELVTNQLAGYAFLARNKNDVEATKKMVHFRIISLVTLLNVSFMCIAHSCLIFLSWQSG